MMANVHKDGKRKCVICGPQELDQFSLCGPNKVGKRYLRRRCDPCRVIQARRRRNPAYRADRYYCEEDSYGMYKQGSIFNHGEMKDALKAGYMPPNSIWIDRLRGKRWKVEGNYLWYFFNDTVNEREDMPEGIVCESQELVEIDEDGKHQPPGGR